MAAIIRSICLEGICLWDTVKADNKIIADSHVDFGMSVDAVELGLSVTGIINTVISGAIAGGISVGAIEWKMRNHDGKRRIEAHTRLLRILEEANKKLADQISPKKISYTHLFTTADREWFTTCMTDPLISDAVHEAYKASKPIRSSKPNPPNAVIHIANLSNLQDVVAWEISRLKRKGYGLFFMCKRNPARQVMQSSYS